MQIAVSEGFLASYVCVFLINVYKAFYPGHHTSLGWS